MNTLCIGLMAFIVGALNWLPMADRSAQADDDWEDYREELEDRREEAARASQGAVGKRRERAGKKALGESQRVGKGPLGSGTGVAGRTV